MSLNDMKDPSAGSNVVRHAWPSGSIASMSNDELEHVEKPNAQDPTVIATAQTAQIQASKKRGSVVSMKNTTSDFAKGDRVYHREQQVEATFLANINSSMCKVAVGNHSYRVKKEKLVKL